ncbi:MAG: VapC toxin family PIN domain ribonuclease [Gemmatimonas sp.]|nr:VapC toxin family PIN domain ribonuclease [Gemmatimonas sp.]
MLAADTNLLVRLLDPDDDDKQGALAARWFRAHATDGVFVDTIVLCELAWVMRARYRKHRRDIHAVLARLLDVEGIVVGDAGAVRRALTRYAAGRGDFADYLLLERAAAAGASPVASFDRALRREKGFHCVG